VSCLQETDMVQRRIRLPFVVTVTVQGLCSVQREKLGAANMRDFVRLCELSKSIHCRREWFVCLFVLVCFVLLQGRLSLVHASGSQSLYTRRS